MWTLGVHGGINTWRHFGQRTPSNWLHDASAALCRNGELVAAAEEERFVRIKHVNFFPVQAIRHCLDAAGIQLGMVDRIVLSSRHMESFNNMFNAWKYGATSWMQSSYVNYVKTLLSEEFGVDKVPALLLGRHHDNHAHSAVWLSGFNDSLCVIMDGWGDGMTGLILTCRQGRLEILRELQARGPASLYLQVTQLLGYDQFDEYKIMGLAPYGNPDMFAEQTRHWIKHKPDGEIEICDLDINSLSVARRMPGYPFLQVHKDVAAALQQRIEEAIFHVISHFRKSTRHSNLCLAGGLFQNCTANGKLLYSGLFENIFVQPIAYDAGLAIGAAVQGYLQDPARPALVSKPMPHLYLGTAIPDPDNIRELLESWQEVIEFSEHDDIATQAAELIAAGKVIGWVQGKAEFGARALGNRSILADPRPAANKDRINEMVKKREGYRPFAPSVLVEYLHEYFDIPANTASLPFMVFVVQVREEYRKLLGAITHVDGSARVQSVSRQTNELYWQLIDRFRQLTSVPLVLNTSFNNSVEPIVDTPLDALNCFLSTNIDALVISRYLVTKRPLAHHCGIMEVLVPDMPERFEAITRKQDGKTNPAIHDRYSDSYHPISRSALKHLLTAVENDTAFGPLETSVAEELNDLWYRRVFTCTRTYR